MMFAFNTADPEDYLSSSGELTFASGDTQQCHTVRIQNDDDCDTPEEEEDFFSNLVLVSGQPVIRVDPATARIVVDDSEDCSKF